MSHSEPTAAVATRQEMKDAKLPIHSRDRCAQELIILNKCRYWSYYAPWKCVDERHSYEKCEFLEFQERVAKMNELREAKEGVRSN